jgi:hypothetical protein
MDEFEARQLALMNRQRRFQAQQTPTNIPAGQMVSGHYVPTNPLTYLADAVRAYGAQKGEQDTERELLSLQKQRRDSETKDMSAFVSALRGTPAQASTTTPTQMPSFDEADAQSMQGVQGYGATTGAQAATPGDPMAAYSLAAASQSPTIRQMGMQGIAQIPQMEARQQERQADRDFRQQQAEADRAARMQQLQEQHALRMQMMQDQNASRQQMMQSQQDFQREMKKLAGSSAASQPYFQPVQTAQGVMAFNARTGRVEPVMGANGQPVVGAAADPALQGQLAGAKTTGAKEAEGRIDARSESRKADMFLQQLTQAENILKQGPTASGVGAAVDAAGRLVGQSTPGAQRAGQLESLSGWLVANVPRMEGPQSNFDVQNYMTMAGKIGDRTVPVKERLAALDQVRQLQQKYKTSADERTGNAPPTATPQKTVVRTGTANGRKVVQYSDGTTAYAD